MNTEPTTDSEQKPRPTEKTSGEKIFDIINYYGLGFGANTAISIYAADIVSHRPNTGVFKGVNTFINNRVTQGEHLSNVLVRDKSILDAAHSIKDALPSLVEQHKDMFSPEMLNEINQNINSGKWNHALYDVKHKFESISMFAEKLNEHLPMPLDATQIQQGAQQIVHQEVIRDVAGCVAGITALCAGGWALMIPVKMLEDNKVGFTKWLDNHVADPLEAMMGKAPRDAFEAQLKQDQREARYHYLEHDAPRQSIGSVVAGRLMSLLPIYALHMSWWKPNNVIKHTGSMMTGMEADPDPKVGFGGAGRYIEGAGEKMFGGLYDHIPILSGFADRARPQHTETLSGVDPFTGREWFQKMGGLITSEVMYSFTAATAFEHISKGLSAMWHKPKENDVVAAPSLKTPPSQQLEETQHDGTVVVAEQKRLAARA